MATPNLRGGSRATLRDVARKAGVHPATASRALNDDTRALVNEETAERVRLAAEELDYRPNPIARGLKTNRSYTIGVLIPDLTNPLFPPILRGIEDRLEEAGYTPLIANTDNDPERELVDTQAMRARQVEGIITATARRDHGGLDDVMAAGLEVVLVNRWLPGVPISAATADDRKGQRMAIEHLAGLGHRRIAHLAGPLDYSTGIDRHDAFLEAVQEFGLDTDPAPGARQPGVHRGRGGPAVPRAARRGGARSRRSPPPTTCSRWAACDVLAERGIACPAQISVVGFNDMPFAGRFQPPLTTIRIPHYEIGTAAAELMLERLRGPMGRRAAAPAGCEPDAWWLRRESTGHPSTAP